MQERIFDQTVLGFIFWGIAVYNYGKQNERATRTFFLLGVLFLVFGVFENLAGISILTMMINQLLDALRL